MKNGICPKCDSSAVIPNLRLESHETDPWVNVTEPEPPQQTFHLGSKNRTQSVQRICLWKLRIY